jgi:hypothetical protein
MSSNLFFRPSRQKFRFLEKFRGEMGAGGGRGEEGEGGGAALTNPANAHEVEPEMPRSCENTASHCAS